MTFLRSLTCAAMAALLGAGAAAAQSAEEAAVKARQSHMQLNAFNLGVLGGMARGNAAYDAEAASAAAENLALLAQIDQSRYWIPGTSNAEMEGTRALPAIWENEADVGAKIAALAEATAAMETAAGEGLESLQAAMGPLGAACGSCHEAYRQAE